MGELASITQEAEMTNTIDFFDRLPVMPSLEELVAKAERVIEGLVLKGVPLVLAYSGGKDSGVVASITLSTVARLVREGRVTDPVIVVTTGNTLIESPEIVTHYQAEHRRMQAFAKANGFHIYNSIVSPSLASSFQVKVLSGRGLPSYAGTNTDCSLDLKQNAQRSYRTKLFKELAARGLPEPCTLIGTRFDESERRALRMKMRGENDLEPVQNRDGEWTFSPVCMWSTDDIWEYVGEVSSGLRESFTDFAETKRIYAHSESQSCAVVADAIREGLSKRKKGGCGARTGCWACQQAEDKSLKNMIEYDERYAYLAGLNKLNQFIRNTRYDWTRRNWIGRTIRAGYIAIQPDTFSGRMVRELARYMMQLDFDEQQRASRAGEAPRFVTLPLEMMVAIDALWSLNGLVKPFAIWADYLDIYQNGVRYDIPDIPETPVTAQPPARFLYVGEKWDETGDKHWTGLRDPFLESLTEASPCAPEITENSRGNFVWDLNTSSSFDVDPESAAMIEMFEAERLAAMHNDPLPPGGITSGYKFYLGYGALQLSHSQAAEHDEILRRTAFKDRLGLTLDYELDDLLAKTVSFADLPQDAYRAWGHKGTTETAQTELLLVA
jgi:DNA sulfur modification protein DndC